MTSAAVDTRLFVAHTKDALSQREGLTMFTAQQRPAGSPDVFQWKGQRNADAARRVIDEMCAAWDVDRYKLDWPVPLMEPGTYIALQSVLVVAAASAMLASLFFATPVLAMAAVMVAVPSALFGLYALWAAQSEAERRGRRYRTAVAAAVDAMGRGMTFGQVRERMYVSDGSVRQFVSMLQP